MERFAGTVSTFAILAAFGAFLAYWWLSGRILQAQRGSRVRTHRAQIVPFFMDAKTLTEDGRRYYRWLNRAWLGFFGCWAFLLVTKLL